LELSHPAFTVAGMAKDTWTDRDLPVLNAIVEMTEQGADSVEPADISGFIGMPEDQVQRALQALADEHPPFFEASEATAAEGRIVLLVANPTGYARRTVGAWPTAETLADRLVQALATAADNEPDEEKRSKAKQTALFLGSAGKDLLVNVLATVIAKQSGIG
jgi:hypothetical protein